MESRDCLSSQLSDRNSVLLGQLTQFGMLRAGEPNRYSMILWHTSLYRVGRILLCNSLQEYSALLVACQAISIRHGVAMGSDSVASNGHGAAAIATGPVRETTTIASVSSVPQGLLGISP